MTASARRTTGAMSAAGAPSARALALLLALCALATLALGTAKLVVQRSRPPAHADPARNEDPLHNRYDGFVSIDQYCVRAERFRDRFRGVAGAREALHLDLTTQGHPSAVLVPVVLALASELTRSIPIAFAALTAAAFLAQIALVRRLAQRLAEAAGGLDARVAGLCGAILVAAHVDSARSAVQLLIDPFAALLATACVWLSLALGERADSPPAGRRSLSPRAAARWLLAVQVAGPLVKLSYLPFLAAPALVAFAARGGERWRAAAGAALSFGLLPLVPALAWVLAVPGWTAFTSEMGIAATYSTLSARELRLFALEMALWFQPLPLALLLARRPALRPATLATLAVTLVFLASVWTLRLPDDYRLYLPALGLWCAACAPSVVLLAGRRLVPALALYAAANAGAALAGLVTGG